MSGYVNSTVKARKPHRCFHCRSFIEPKTEYTRQAIFDEDGIYVLKFHEDCDQACWAAGKELELYHDEGTMGLINDMEDDQQMIWDFIEIFKSRYPDVTARFEKFLLPFNEDEEEQEEEDEAYI